MSSYGADSPGPLARLLELLGRSFRLGRFFRVEVRMYLVAAVLMPLLFLHWYQPIAATGLERITLSAFAFVSLYTIVWTHEMGHIAMARRYHITTPLITLSPLGGLAHLGTRAPTPRSELWITLAGPAVHLAWLAVFWPLQRWMPYDLVVVPGWRTAPLGSGVDLLYRMNVTFLLFNLLPLFPMDGGRALRALLALRMDAGRATIFATTVGIGGAILMGLYGFSAEGVYGTFFVFLAFANFQACMRERMSARHHPVYGGIAARSGFESDPEAWRSGRDPFGAVEEVRERRPGPIARWQMRRAADQAERTRRRDSELEHDVDRVLARLHDVGMTGLTDKERDVLRRASERRRAGH
jgi:Zn-dependent protease